MLIFPASAHVPGEDPNSELYKWADRQVSDIGKGCCGHGDSHVLPEDRVRTVHGDYEVEIDGRWYRIAKPWLLRDVIKDPNPSGHGVVWYGPNIGMPGGVEIYCFSPPTLL